MTVYERIQPNNDWDPKAYQANAAFVPALGAPVLALLNPQPGEHILDLGCGDGVLTVKIRAAGCTVLGVDSSAPMIDAARQLGLEARVMDGMALDFPPSFDAVFTNAALHWMLDHDAMARGVFAALKPGGRFVGEFGGFGNIAAIRTGIRAVVAQHGYALPDQDPQNYGEPATFCATLERAGFVGAKAELIYRPTPLPTGIVGWLETFRQGFLDPLGIPREAQPALRQEISDFLQPVLQMSDGTWIADYVRIRFSAAKTA